MKINAFTLSFLLFIPQVSSALDATCAPIIAASEARMKQPFWQSVSDINGSLRLETIKTDNKYFTRLGKEAWKPAPVNIDETEQRLLARVQNGEINLTQCKEEASEMLEGRETRVISYHIEINGWPAVNAKLKIGKADGLPYSSTSKSTNTRYNYAGVQMSKP